MANPDQTAREEARRAILWPYGDVGEHDPDALLDAYRDECRHEAAEEQRAAQDAAERQSEQRHGFIDHEMQLQTEAVNQMANLIDPKVTP